MKQLVAVLPLFMLAGCVYREPEVVYRDPYRETVVVDDGPVVVQEYYFVDGRYYYWHEGYGRYEVYDGVPRAGFHVYRDRPLPERHAIYGPARGGRPIEHAREERRR